MRALLTKRDDLIGLCSVNMVFLSLHKKNMDSEWLQTGLCSAWFLFQGALGRADRSDQQGPSVKKGRESSNNSKACLPQPKCHRRSKLSIKFVLTFQKGSLLRLGWEYIAQRYSMYFRTRKIPSLFPRMNMHVHTTRSVANGECFWRNSHVIINYLISMGEHAHWGGCMITGESLPSNTDFLLRSKV